MDLLTLLALLVGPGLVLFLLVGLAEELGLVARPEEDEAVHLGEGGPKEEREAIRAFLDGLFGEDEGEGA